MSELQPDDGPVVGRRGRKKARTRAAIQHEALRLFREKGYDRTTMEEIAEAADVSASTLFRHFSSKEAMVLTQEHDSGRRLRRRDAGRRHHGRHAVRRALLGWAQMHRRSLSYMRTAERSQRQGRGPLRCGVIAGPLFAGAFTAIGATREGYDWRRFPVSSLAIGRRGWLQRANFIVAGALYTCASRGLARRPGRRVGPRAVPILVAGVGIGLIGSGVFVTDPVDGFPPGTPDEDRFYDPDATRTAATREGLLHNLCAVPIFVGIPIAGFASAATAVRSRDYRWACYSAGSSLMMVASFVVFGRAFGGASDLAGKGGIFQRISIASGFGWLTVLSLRARSSLPVRQ